MVYEEDDSSYGYYYDQLSAESRAVYRAIYKQPSKVEGVEIILPQTLSITVKDDESEEGLQARITGIVLEITQPAIDALLYDHPSIFYMKMGGEESSSFSLYHRREDHKEGGATVYMRKLLFYLRTENLLPSQTMEEQISDLQNAVSHFTVEGESRYERLRFICDELARTVSYDASAARPHSSVGALIDGLAVCDGYAKALKLLCDREQIPCIIVAGKAIQNGNSEPHAWNYVQMEDGAWYGLDITWDDVGHTATENYFLVGADDSGFLDSHVPGGRFSEGEHAPFVYPTLSDANYIPV